MHINLWCFFCKIQELAPTEEGQDLIEYALVVSLIALAAIISMQSVASAINSAFASIASQLASAT